MKKHFFLPLTFLLLFLLAGCKKFLEVQPKEQISDDQRVVIYDRLTSEAALRGVYSALAHSNYYGESFVSLGYLNGDNIQWTGSQSQVQEFITHNLRSDNATTNLVWTGIYKTINRANTLISEVAKVNDASLTTELKNRYIGEAYFLRGLAYFDLARVFGGVPLITQPTVLATDNSGIPRSSLAHTYAQVLRDLEQAELLLPAAPLNTADLRFRATKKTVWALKARYYLYQQDWAKAEQFATQIINDAATFKLVTPYSAFFAGNARSTTESIFELFYNGTTELNTHRNTWQPQTNGGTRQIAPNNAFITLDTNKTIGGGRSALVARDNQNRWFGNLYYRNPASDPSFILRIAEQYLIRAEARVKLNSLEGALADLNAIRTRAGITPSVAATTEDLLLAIENERRLEFVFEADRWFDLVRTGRAATVLNIKQPHRFLHPIPIQQLQVDKALVQNPGY